MKVTIVTERTALKPDLKSDIIILASDYKTVKYKTELSGESAELKLLAKRSEKSNAVIISAFDTDNYGILRHSAGVFDKGKLLGISDMSVSYADSPYMPGTSGGIYETEFGKIAVAVGDDFYSYELLRAYAVCGVKATFALKRESPAPMDEIVLRAYAYLLGMPMVLVSGGKILYSDFKGRIKLSAERYAETEILTVNDYFLSVSKTRFSK